MSLFVSSFECGRRLLTICGVLLVIACSHTAFGQKRVFEPADLGRLEQLNHRYASFTFSPDGELLAFVVERPKSRLSPGPTESLLTEERCDVWLTSTRTLKTWNLTNGSEKSAGFFMPAWSPDGNSLAMMSSHKNSDEVVVWDRRSGQIRSLINQAIDYWYVSEPSLVWASNDTLLCFLRPQGRRPTGVEGQRLSAEIAAREWRKSWEGTKPTANVLESGVSPTPTVGTELARLNIRSGKAEKLAVGTFRNLQLSPNRQYLAFLRQTKKFRPDSSHTFSTRSFRRYTVLNYQVEILDQTGTQVSLSSIPFVNPDSMSWNLSGNKLSVVAEDPDAPEGSLWTYEIDLNSRSIRKLIGQTVERSGALWLDDQAVVQSLRIDNSTASPSSRMGWVVTKKTNEPIDLTPKLPIREVVQMDGDTLIANAGDRLWRIKSDNLIPQSIDINLDRNQSIAWPLDTSQPTRKPFRLIVKSQNSANPTFDLIDIDSRLKWRFPLPSQDASLVGYDLDRTAVFIASNRTGTYIWLSEAGSQTAKLVYGSNQFLLDISEGKRQSFEYKSLDRKTLTAWTILPPNYEKGKRYPVVTWVYPGRVLGKELPGLTDLNSPHPLNLQQNAAQGFVVLIPSIPLSPEGQVSDASGELLNGVIPAIDKLVELGIADPDRVAVAGQSWGGFAALSLITQTRRFAAAIALAGPSDYFSSFSEFSLQRRYLDDPLDPPIRMINIEGLTTLSLRFGNPPWRDFGLFLRNSPMFLVDRVQTPLLLIHGDMDIVQIEQAEQFFNGLYRQGKRARFVRYWGEGHILNSPPNIKDAWGQIYKWLDEFLKPPQ